MFERGFMMADEWSSRVEEGGSIRSGGSRGRVIEERKWGHVRLEIGGKLGSRASFSGSSISFSFSISRSQQMSDDKSDET